jgi:two-component system invasion response regulator UvrY
VDPHPDDGSPVRLLVVEDHPALALAFQELLGADDRLIVVGCVSTAADALAHESLAAVDVVLCDVHLPDGDGITLMRALHRAYPDVAVIIMSGSGDSDTHPEAISEGAYAYLEKGRIYDEVIELILRAAGDLAPDDRVDVDHPAL